MVAKTLGHVRKTTVVVPASWVSRVMRAREKKIVRARGTAALSRLDLLQQAVGVRRWSALVVTPKSVADGMGGGPYVAPAFVDMRGACA